MKILLIDNNDSFTYNLLHLIESACNGDEVIEVWARDRLTITEASKFDQIVISPGSGIPSQSKVLSQIITTYEQQIPILGICLGHQAIAECYGAPIVAELSLKNISLRSRSAYGLFVEDSFVCFSPERFIKLG